MPLEPNQPATSVTGSGYDPSGQRAYVPTPGASHFDGLTDLNNLPPLVKVNTNCGACTGNPKVLSVPMDVVLRAVLESEAKDDAEVLKAEALAEVKRQTDSGELTHTVPAAELPTQLTGDRLQVAGATAKRAKWIPFNPFTKATLTRFYKDPQWPAYKQALAAQLGEPAAETGGEIPDPAADRIAFLKENPDRADEVEADELSRPEDGLRTRKTVLVAIVRAREAAGEN